LMSLLMLEEDNQKEYFNVKYLKALADNGRSFLMNKDDTGRYGKYGNNDNHYGVNKPIDIIHMYVRLIPESKGLSRNSRPEIWLFSLAADQVVIRAQPLNLDHNMFPVTVNARTMTDIQPHPYHAWRLSTVCSRLLIGSLILI